MNIGILTFHRALNYGAVLQCYALKRTCELLGHKVNVIDYNPFGHYTIKGLLRHNLKKGYHNIKQYYGFNRFVEKYLSLTEHSESYDYIRCNCPKFDAYIVGSDQVWCEGIVGEYFNSYMLDFVPDSSIKIAYAVSMGGGMVNDNIEMFKRQINRFKSISLREPTFISNIQSLINEDKCLVSYACDPSLLLDKSYYQMIEHKVYFLPKQYILLYDVSESEHIKQCALRLKEKYKLPIINVAGLILKWVDKNIYGSTPSEWLYLINHCTFMVTNSFHGLCFSIIFRKQFIVCPNYNNDAIKVKNDRMINLLKKTDLLSNYINNIDDLNHDILIDYSTKEDIIKIYQQHSMNFLSSALNNNFKKC